MQPDLIEIRGDCIGPGDTRGKEISPNERSEFRHVRPQLRNHATRYTNETGGQNRRAGACGVRRLTCQPPSKAAGGDRKPPYDIVERSELRSCRLIRYFRGPAHVSQFALEPVLS